MMLHFRLAFVAMAIPALSAAAEPTSLNPVMESYPSISPDGKTIIFQSTRLGRRALFRADADGANLRLFLDTRSNPVTATWSPDGKRVAFADEIAGDSEIFVVDADGRNVRRLTNVKADDSHPYWSPDGSRIFFSSNRNTPDMSQPFGRQWHDIFSVRPDGSEIRQHTDCKSVCTYPAPSPDGKRVAYRKLLFTPGMRWDLSVMAVDSEIFVINLDGTGERNLTSNPAYEGWPAWSPDGCWIAFASNRSGPANTGQIHIVAPDGGNAQQITSGHWSSTTPRWSPDSAKIYVYKHQDMVTYEFGSIGMVDVPKRC